MHLNEKRCKRCGGLCSVVGFHLCVCDPNQICKIFANREFRALIKTSVQSDGLEQIISGKVWVTKTLPNVLHLLAPIPLFSLSSNYCKWEGKKILECNSICEVCSVHL